MYESGAGRRTNAPSPYDKEFEMRPLTNNGSMYEPRAKSPTSTTVQNFVDKLKSNTARNQRVRFRGKTKNRKERSHFAVNVPTRLIFHLIIFFFLIPLTLGMLLLIRALFFGLKEDEAHPLHKKIPNGHLKHSSDSIPGVDEMLGMNYTITDSELTLEQLNHDRTNTSHIDLYLEAAHEMDEEKVEQFVAINTSLHEEKSNNVEEISHVNVTHNA